MGAMLSEVQYAGPCRVPQVRPSFGLTWDRRLDTPNGVGSVPYQSDVGEIESEWTPEIADENVGAPVRVFLPQVSVQKTDANLGHQAPGPLPF
jgi:hypothetical protein